MSDLMHGSAAKIRKLYQQFEGIREEMQGLYRKSVPLIYEIGELLAEVKKTLDHGDFIPWIEQNLPFNRNTAINYMRVHEHFSKCTTVGHLENLTLTDAYVAAGVKKLIPSQPEHKDRLLIAGGGRRSAEELHISPKALSDNPPKFHRVDFMGEWLHLARRGHRPRPLMCLYYKPPEGLPLADYQELQKNIRIAWEIYFRRVEEAEEAGLCHPPREVPFKEQVKKNSTRGIPKMDLRDVTPRKEK